MLTRNLIRILIVSTISISLYSCKTEEVVLNGDIVGYVTEDEFLQPVKAVTLKISSTNDTTISGIDGKYQFNNLRPGEYEVEALKPPYEKTIKSAVVKAGKTDTLDFVLHKISYYIFSVKYLDFGFDSTLKSFTITNSGTGTLNYSIIASQNWINVSPNIGAVTTKPDTIKVMINRTGLSEKKHMENIEIVSHVGQDLIKDTVDVLVNGVMDQDLNYYGVVTIGTQTWLAENLNTGTAILLYLEQQDNGIIEKWCYDCKTYGGLYNWFEAMKYNPSDTGTIGTTQGICPAGWHMPTPKEMNQLLDYCGEDPKDWSKLKEVGYAHWLEPNNGATDEYGFTALPGGNTDRCTETGNCSDPYNNKIYKTGTRFMMWSTVWSPPFQEGWLETATYLSLGNEVNFGILDDTPWCGKSVRCIKNP
jgi:uncharacterized protein (TIGR02145 family)